MAIEDFGTYTEVDPSSTITKTTRRVTWASLTSQEDAYVYSDKGVDEFSGNFIHYLTIELTAATVDGRAYVWALTNTVDDIKGIGDASGSFLTAFLYCGSGPTYYITLTECDSGSIQSDAYVITLNTVYYLKIVRDESVGTYGRIYCYIYTDPDRSTLVDTLFLILRSSKKDFQYIFGLNTRNSGISGRTTSGHMRNLELTAIQLEVTIQPVTSITATTATGNGIIVDTGIASVTAHGHCWATTIDPTTGDNSVDNGAGTLGAYTTSMENLVAGQQYYVRAWVTSTEGTIYSANVVFIATSETTSTQLIAGNLAIVQGRLQYMDASGVERYITGAAV